jgi:hypothetical protein
MTTDEVIEAIVAALADHEGSERDLYDRLIDMAEGWKLRLEEESRAEEAELEAGTDEDE